jgi:YHS domain-containing protein
MYKNTVLGLIFCGLLLTSGVVFAGTVASSIQPSDASALKSQEVGNKICPVTGEKIDENSKVTYEYKGKIYNLCCSGCIEEFRNNPEKYIKIIEAEK